MCDLTEIMRQQGGPLFIENLNVACVGDLSDRDIEILNSRKGDIENAPADLTVIFTENSPKDSFNNAKLENLSETDLETLLLIKFQKEHLQHFLRILMQKIKAVQVVWQTVFTWRKMLE